VWNPFLEIILSSFDATAISITHFIERHKD
jgi:hypothetical protein